MAFNKKFISLHTSYFILLIISIPIIQVIKDTEGKVHLKAAVVVSHKIGLCPINTHQTLSSDVSVDISDRCSIYTYQLGFNFVLIDKHTNAKESHGGHAHDHQLQTLKYVLTSLQNIK